MAVLSDTELLRLYLEDQLPEGSSATNATFTDNEIETFLSVAEGDVQRAASLGWKARAAALAKLVDQSEGPSKVSLRQKHQNALAMAESFGKGGSTGRGTRIRRITREGAN